MLRRFTGLVVVAASAAIGALLVGATPATAHASLSSTVPDRDTIVAAAPEEVVLHFDAAVSIDLDAGIRVFAADGRQIDLDDSRLTDGNTTVSVGIDDAGVGTYTVAWKVVSEDSHVLSGSFVFHVQQPTGAVAVDVDEPDRAALDVLAWFARWLIVMSAAVLGGAAAYRIAIAARGDAPDRTTRRLMIATAAVGVLGAALRLLAQVADASGESLTGAFGTVSDAVRSTRAGHLDAWRIVLALLLLAAAMLWRHLSSAVMVAAGVMAIAIVNALAGHAWTADRRPLSLVADVAHQAGVAVWVGGMVALLLVLRGRPEEPGWYLARFSALALASVAVITVSGVLGAWQQLESASAILDSVYGRALLVKLAAVAGMVALGWRNRGRLRASAERVAGIVTNVRVEAALGAATLALTAALVGLVPGREVANEPRPYAAEIDDAAGEASVSVTPARAGLNTLHVYFTDTEGGVRTVDVAGAKVSTAGVPERSVGLAPVVQGHFAAPSFSLPTPGRWTFTVSTSTKGVPSEFSFEVVIR